MAQPPNLWDSLLPFAPLITPVVVAVGAAVAFLGVLLTVRQKQRIDARTAWWARAEWAITLALSSDDRSAELGARTLTLLAQTGPPLPEDLRLLRAVTEQIQMDAEKALLREKNEHLQLLIDGTEPAA